MHRKLNAMGKVLLMLLLLVVVAIAGCSLLYLVTVLCSNCAVYRLSKLLPLLVPFIWPGLTVLAVVVFYGSIRKAICEIPSFIHRSHYGDGSASIDSVSVKWGAIMVASESDDAQSRVKEMRDREFTACPVLTSDGRLFGVFTIGAWVDYRIHCKDCAEASIGKILSFQENQKLLSDKLPYTMFVERDETLLDARIRFVRLCDMGYPLILLSVSKDRRLLSMITPIDLFVAKELELM